MFLTTKKVQDRIATAVEAARIQHGEELRSLMAAHAAMMNELQVKLAVMKADAAERDTEWERKLSQRIAAERQYHHAAVTGLMTQIAGLETHVGTLASEHSVHDRVQWLTRVVQRNAEQQWQETRETTDTIQYLMDAPTPVQVIREVESGVEVPDLSPRIAELHQKITDLRAEQRETAAQLTAAVQVRDTEAVTGFAASVAALNAQVAGLEAQLAAVQRPTVVVQGQARGWTRSMGAG